jgi:transposase
MSRGRPKASVVLTTAERGRLECLANTATPEVSVSKRAKIVLLCAEGLDNREVARRLGISAHTMGRWRAQFVMAGVRGLDNASNHGGRRSISTKQVDDVVAIALELNPAGGTPLSTRLISEVVGLSHNSVHQIWRSFGIKPHKTTAFNLSANSLPIDKVWDVIGLYLKPPVHVLAVCIDEKSQVEVVSGELPPPPRRPRKSARDTLASDGADTVIISEVVEVMASAVIDDRYSREEAAGYRKFLDRIDAAAPTYMDVHLVVDNYNTHNAQEIREWMAERPRFQLHLAPTHDSWLDQVDRWFEMPVHGHPDLDEHQSEASFQAAAEDFLAARDDDAPKPFVWAKSADAIKATIARSATTP